MSNTKIPIDQNGYNRILEQIENYKTQLKQIVKEKGEACSDDAGNGTHDNFSFEQAKLREITVLCEIEALYKKLNQCVIVNKTSDNSIIDFDSIVLLRITYDEHSIDESWFKLVGSNPSTNIEHYMEITSNSPIGKAIYKRNVGETLNTVLFGNEITIEILEKKLFD